MQAGEEEHQEDQTVFPTVIGEGELREAVTGEGRCGDVEGDASLALNGGEEGIGRMGLGEKGVHFVVALGDYF